MDTETGHTDEIAPQGLSDAGGGAGKRRSTQRGDAPILTLNERWRIAHDGAPQWILQIREGKNWIGRRFHGERDQLLRSIRELCGAVDPATVETIRSWLSRYRPGFAAVSRTAAIPLLVQAAA